MADQGWDLVPNPGYADHRPRLLEPACHDRSPLVTIQCACGEQMHVHETQIAAVPRDAGIATLCKACTAPLVFGPGQLAGAFAELRRQGWIG